MFRRRAGALALVLLLPALARADSFRPFAEPLPVGPFALTERSGRSVTRDDLRGKIWVAHFFYCTCEEGCAETTASMARLQKDFAKHKDVVLVSIHVYPQGEDMEQLRQYALGFSADPERWLFLTGARDIVYDTVQKSFFLPVEERKEAKRGYTVGHRFSLMLIDREGLIRGYAEGKDPQAVTELADRVHELAGRTSFRERARAVLPSLNASLNGLCFILLVAGYAAIRRRRERLHTVLMLAALGVSLVFLASYLFYHFAVLEGQPTRFRGEGLMRPVYFVILGSHTLLAAVVAPLALVTVYLGLRDRRETHRRFSRWTFPIWLYVSITGVIVYVMLYHLYPSG